MAINKLRIVSQARGRKLGDQIVTITSVMVGGSVVHIVEHEKSREDHIATMKDPARWSLHPKLPLYRNEDDTRHIGFLLADDVLRAGGTAEIVVYCGTVWLDLSDIAERITFDNIEAVYDSGWRVD